MSTHHCSSCGKCVYLMDHHCFWTGNCVGYLTLKPFVLYNVYQSILMGYQIYMMWLIARQQGLTHISFALPDLFGRFQGIELDPLRAKQCEAACSSADRACLSACAPPAPLNLDTFLDAATFYPLLLGLAYNQVILIMFFLISLHNYTFVDVWKTGNYTHPTLPRRSLADWILFVFNEDSISLRLFNPSIITRNMDLENKRVTAILDTQLEDYLKKTDKKKLNEYCKYMMNELEKDRGVSAMVRDGKLKSISEI